MRTTTVIRRSLASSRSDKRVVCRRRSEPDAMEESVWRFSAV